MTCVFRSGKWSTSQASSSMPCRALAPTDGSLPYSSTKRTSLPLPQVGCVPMFRDVRALSQRPASDFKAGWVIRQSEAKDEFVYDLAFFQFDRIDRSLLRSMQLPGTQQSLTISSSEKKDNEMVKRLAPMPNGCPANALLRSISIF